MFPNTNFDPVAGSRLYNEYLEQYMLAEEVGIDGIMLNEHHNAPFCMQAKCNVFASILAAMTSGASSTEKSRLCVRWTVVVLASVSMNKTCSLLSKISPPLLMRFSLMSGIVVEECDCLSDPQKNGAR